MFLVLEEPQSKKEKLKNVYFFNKKFFLEKLQEDRKKKFISVHDRTFLGNIYTLP